MPPDSLSEATLAAAAHHLAKRDKDLALILTTYGPPPLWARPQGFPTLLRIILEQQVSLASADSMFQRLKKNIIPLTARRFLELGEPHLKSLGLTRQKTAYCLHLSESLVEKRISLARLARMDDINARASLMALKGIGPWSADIYLLMALRRPDIWPTNDLALSTAAARVKSLKRKPDSNELSKIAEKWRPYRSVAARMLWQYYLAQAAKRSRP
jgi:DNA-3-methyladenine glycosylase II